MEKWQNFFLQRMGLDGSSPYPMYESVSEWGVWCKDIPFQMLDKVKAPAKRNWYDEHGDDEYISVDGMYLEAYTMTVEFGCKKMGSITTQSGTISAIDDVRVKVGAFLDYLRSSGMLMMYSSHTRVGRREVRLDSVDDKTTWKSEDGQEFLVFKVTFKVNDPVTDVIKDGNSLIVDEQ